MKQISRGELDAYVAANTILFGTLSRPALMLTPEGEIVKSIYQRKLISRSTLLPQAKRFANNSDKLRRIGILAPEVSKTMFCSEVPVHMVVYPRIPGEDLRTICMQGDLDILVEFAEYLAHLHAMGVYFRAIHLGNILKVDGHGMGLVDIADLKIKRGPLPVFTRARNIAHLFGIDDDQSFFLEFGVSRFLDVYSRFAALSGLQRRLLQWRMDWSTAEEMKRR